MKLRNGKSYIYKEKDLYEPLYEVNIDFDESSKAWRKNKIENDNGTFIYKYYIDFMEWVRSLFN